MYNVVRNNNGVNNKNEEPIIPELASSDDDNEDQLLGPEEGVSIENNFPFIISSRLPTDASPSCGMCIRGPFHYTVFIIFFSLSDGITFKKNTEFLCKIGLFI